MWTRKCRQVTGVLVPKGPKDSARGFYETAQPVKPGRFIEEQDFSIATTKLAGIGLLKTIHKADIGTTVEPLPKIKV
jgi:hypothetical protein